MKRKRLAYLLILPAVIGMLFVHFIPMIWGFIISFMDLDITYIMDWTAAPFIGLKNYMEGFSQVTTIGRRFIRSLINVGYFGFLTVSIGYFLGLGVALLLNKPFPGRTFVRGLILLPYITPDTVVFNFWRFIFQARIGILNKMLKTVGIIDHNLIWLVGDRSLYAVAVAAIWKWWPFGALVLLAGLQAIPGDIYEAARIDGASGWQRFKYITFPYLKPVTKTFIIMNILWNFNAFNQFYVMLGSDPGLAAEVPSTLILRQAFNHLDYGLGSALSMMLFAIMIVVTGLYFYFFRIRSGEDA